MFDHVGFASSSLADDDDADPNHRCNSDDIDVRLDVAQADPGAALAMTSDNRSQVYPDVTSRVVSPSTATSAPRESMTSWTVMLPPIPCPPGKSSQAWWACLCPR